MYLVQLTRKHCLTVLRYENLGLFLESYGIIIGTDTDGDYAYMDEYGIAKTTPEDLRGELSENAKAIANMLISMGLAKRFADGVTLIGWEV